MGATHTAEICCTASQKKREGEEKEKSSRRSEICFIAAGKD